MTRRTLVYLTAITGALSMSLLCAQVAPPETTVQKLTPDEMKALAAGDTKYFFLDVREPKELEDLGTLPGYVNIPMGELESRLSEVPKDRLVVVACRSGARAAKAAAMMEKAGYTQLRLFAMKEYVDKGYEAIHPKVAEKK